MLSVIPLGIEVGVPEALAPDFDVVVLSCSLAPEAAFTAVGLADSDGAAVAPALALGPAVASPDTSWPSSVRSCRSSDHRKSVSGWIRSMRGPSYCHGVVTNSRFA